MKKQEANNRRKGYAHSKTVELHRGQLTGRALLIADSASTLDLPNTISVLSAELGPERF
jgi:2-oxoglutarate ferredoxin oxidoreductase subunit alpha